MFGYTGDKRAGLEQFIHVGEIFAMLRAGDSIVLTGGGHTTTVYSDCSGAVIAFDSLPASVTPVTSADALTAALLRAHSGMLEFTATMLRADAVGTGRKRARDT